MTHHTSTQPGSTGAPAGSQGYPVDNITYDLLSALHTKLEGLEAYKKYVQDAQGDQECQQLFQQLQQQDIQVANQIKQHLIRHLGKSSGAQ